MTDVRAGDEILVTYTRGGVETMNRGIVSRNFHPVSSTSIQSERGGFLAPHRLSSDYGSFQHLDITILQRPLPLETGAEIIITAFDGEDLLKELRAFREPDGWWKLVDVRETFPDGTTFASDGEISRWRDA